MTTIPMITIGGGLALLSLLSVGTSEPVPTQTEDAVYSAADNRYIGAKKCKSCHKGDAKGKAYEIWEEGPHAKAFETLGTDQAKEIAKEMGIEDPQKADECLECHVTGFGVAKEEIKKGFKQKYGVQCESCHGPGETHFKTRMAEASKDGDPAPVGEGEILVSRSAELCTKCHNEKSPTHKEFCFKERMKAIEHFDPRKGRSEEDIEKIRGECSPDCKVCGKKEGE